MNNRAMLAALLLALAGTSVFAHGDGKAGKPPPLKGEQKAFGIAGDARAVQRTIEITMTDAMRFTPDRIEVRQGEVVKFVVTNGGKMLHEFVIGTKRELDEHAALMLRFPNMEHDEPSMAHVKPGRKAELTWNFNRPGEFEFACLIAGHYQAGMVGRIKVIATQENKT